MARGNLGFENCCLAFTFVFWICIHFSFHFILEQKQGEISQQTLQSILSEEPFHFFPINIGSSLIWQCSICQLQIDKQRTCHLNCCRSAAPTNAPHGPTRLSIKDYLPVCRQGVKPNLQFELTILTEQCSAAASWAQMLTQVIPFPPCADSQRLGFTLLKDMKLLFRALSHFPTRLSSNHAESQLKAPLSQCIIKALYPLGIIQQQVGSYPLSL